MARLMTKKGTTGIRRRLNRYRAPSRASPWLMPANRAPNRACTLSRNTKRAVRKDTVAPRVEAKDTSSRPQPNPKMPPPASVRMAAPGSDSEATATYSAKKAPRTVQGASRYSALSPAWLVCR